MAAKPRYLFVNVAVRDLAVSKAFFSKLGFEFDPKFTNDEAACMVVSDKAFVMLLTHGQFGNFAKKPIVDSTAATEALLALSAESREAVDSLADTALASGGAVAGDPMDYGFMCQRSFTDPDGHHWEVMWMDQKAVEMGPEEFAAQQQSA